MREIETNNSHYEGYLKKWTNYLKQYQRRWFVHENGYLKYYRTRSEIGELTRAEIYLRGCKLVINNNNGFVIIKNSETIFVLYAENIESFNNWIKTLRYGIILSNNEGIHIETSLNVDKQRKREEMMRKLDESEMSVSEKIIMHSRLTHGISEQMNMVSERMKQIVLSTINENNGDVIKNKCFGLSVSLAEFNALNHKLIDSVQSLISTAENVAEDAADNRASNKNKSSHQLRRNSNKMESSNDADVLNVKEEDQISSGNEKFYDAEEDFNHTQVPDSAMLSTYDADVASSALCSSDKLLHHVRSASDLVITTSVPSANHRASIPNRPNVKSSLWSIISNMIGKDLSKVPLPVNFNEPISMLQRVTESLEYSYLLDKAAACQCAQLQLCYVMAFAISSYASTAYRTGKPFNPLLGETFEYDRSSDLGWRCVCEQVSHHPPVCALYAEGNGWMLWETYDVKSKFLAKYLEIHPLGLSQLVFTHTGYHISWNRVGTTVNNIVIGTLWIDQFGKMNMVNRTTGDSATVDFHSYSVFRSDDHKKVTGYVKDSNKENKYSISGRWDKFIESCKLVKDNKETPVNRTVLWTANKLPPNADKMYNFSPFTCSLNEITPGVAPTDCRNRPDQRAMENGDFEKANELKSKLENAQRERSKRMLKEAIDKGQAQKNDQIESIQAPTWFKIDTNAQHEACKIYAYKGGYWEAKEKQDFSACPNIFEEYRT